MAMHYSCNMSSINSNAFTSCFQLYVEGCRASSTKSQGSHNLTNTHSQNCWLLLL